MARIDERAFRSYIDGQDRMTAQEYMRDRNILREAINDLEDKYEGVGAIGLEEVNDNINNLNEDLAATNDVILQINEVVTEKPNKDQVQMHKLTSDTGERIQITTDTVDLLTLPPGFYETTGNKLSHAPWTDGGYVEVDIQVFQTRRQVTLNYSYSKKFFIGNFHTNGEFKGWKEIAVNDKIGAHVENLMYAMYEKVAALQTAKTVSLGFITDTHYIRNNPGTYGEVGLQHVNNIVDFSRTGLLDLLIHGGDLINGKTAPNVYKRELAEMVKAINAAECPKMICKGNHDYGVWHNANITNPKLSNVLSPLDWYKRFTKPFQKDFVIDSSNPTGSYFYKDFDQAKLRVIVLNTADTAYLANADGTPKYLDVNHHAMSGAQMSWLATKALDFSGKTDAANWNVITFSHVTPRGSDNSSKVVCSQVFAGIINAFKNGTSYVSSNSTGDYPYNVNVNFAGRAGRHIAHIGGHYHIDQNYVSDNIRYITVLLSAPVSNTSGEGDSRPRDMYTETEDSWCVFTIDTDARKLYLSRFGQGDDNLIIDY